MARPGYLGHNSRHGYYLQDSGTAHAVLRSLWCKQVISGTASDVFQVVVR
jgi:hypothetical protein